MLSKFTKMMDKLGGAISDKYSKMTDKMQKSKIVQIVDRLYHIEYPNEGNIAQLIQHARQGHFQVWNISEYSYEDKLVNLFQANKHCSVHHLKYQFYASLPMCELINSVQMIQHFLQECEKNTVYLHCQDNKLRSAIFFVAYLYITDPRVNHDISQAILFVNKCLGISLQDQPSLVKNKSYHAQHQLLKNLANFYRNRSLINKNQLSLIKVMIKNIPRLQKFDCSSTLQFNQAGVKVHLEIRMGQTVVHKSMQSQVIVQGESISFKINPPVLLSDDFLIILKYSKDKTVYNILRSQLNTNFIFDVVTRVTELDMDLSSFCMPSQSEAISIDMLFNVLDTLSQLAKIEQSSLKKETTKTISIESKEPQCGPQNFNLDDTEAEETQLDEKELSQKIEKVLMSMNKKEDQLKQDNDKHEDDTDLDDYLSKLEAQAQ